MSEELVKFEFKLHRLSSGEKKILLDRLGEELMRVEDLIFAYVHGSFVELEEFRDVDIAVWIRDPEEAFIVFGKILWTVLVGTFVSSLGRSLSSWRVGGMLPR